MYFGGVRRRQHSGPVPSDRDQLVRKTPPVGVRAQTAAPEAVAPETSEAYEDPDARDAFRAGQSDPKRIKRLEKKVDAIVEKHAADNARFEAKLDTAVTLLQESATERKERHDREQADRDAREKAAERRATTMRALFTVVAPIILAVGGIITGIVAAVHSSGGK